MEAEMDKLKFAIVLLFFTGLLAGLGWAGYAAFCYLGFQKSALVVLLLEGFFTVRGTYLIAVAWNANRQELKELRLDMLRFSAAVAEAKCRAAPLVIKPPLAWPRSYAARMFAAAIVACSLFGAFLAFGGMSSILLAAVIFQGLLVRYLYKLRREIALVQNELEDYRLTFAKNEKNRSLDV